jgi:uncharacterized protein involved in exopolysaccharide biosynthesis
MASSTASAGLASPGSSASSNPALEFLSILNRRKGTILFVFLIVTGIVAVGAASAPPVYRAEASLMVRIGREYIYRPEVGRAEAARMPSLSEMVNSEVEILNSRDLAAQVVEELGVETLYPQLLELETEPMLATERAVLLFRGGMSVRGVLESSIIKLAFEHPDPQIAADALNLLVERFKDKHIEVFGEERSSFLDEQLERSGQELAKAEEALSAFKRENGVYDLGQQRSLLLGQLVRLDEVLRACEIDIAELEARLASLDGAGHESLPPSQRAPELKEALLTELKALEAELREVEPSQTNTYLEEARLKLLELELQENELRRNYKESNRLVEGVRADMARVQAYMEEAQKRLGMVIDPGRRQAVQERVAWITGELEAMARAQVLDELAALQIQRAGHIGKLESLDHHIQLLDQQEKTLRKLERELTQAEAKVQIYRERAEEARITEELDREKRINVRVIERASRPLAPTGLSRNMKIALGGFVGLLSGAAVAVFLELFRPR